MSGTWLEFFRAERSVKGERAVFTPLLVHFIAITNGRILIVLTALYLTY